MKQELSNLLDIIIDESVIPEIQDIDSVLSRQSILGLKVKIVDLEDPLCYIYKDPSLDNLKGLDRPVAYLYALDILAKINPILQEIRDNLLEELEEMIDG